MTVIISERAWEDLRRNARWWSKNRSAEQAAGWYDDIRTTIASLTERPQQWPVARENEKFSIEIREFHFRISSRATHRIVFTIRDDEVLVIAVRHVKEDDMNPEELSTFD